MAYTAVPGWLLSATYDSKLVATPLSAKASRSLPDLGLQARRTVAAFMMHACATLEG